MKQPVWPRALKVAALEVVGLIAALSLPGCVRQPCGDPDVLAFVADQKVSRDLYAIGLAPAADVAPLSRPVAAPVGIDRHAAVCSAWILARNPAFAPGNGEHPFVRERQDFRLKKLAQGYEVALIRHP